MITIITGVLGIAVACTIIVLVRKDRLHASHGFGWMVAALGFSLLGVAPGIVDWIARLLGVGYPPVLALTLAVAMLVVKTLLMDIERSRLSVKVQRLTQKLSIIEAELEEERDSTG